eukprot:1282006-Rhodomonas_salina.1
MVDLSLGFDSLSSHMVRIALLHNKAVSYSSEQDIDSKILGTLIKKLQEADGDESLLPVSIWRAASTKWYTDYQKDPSSVQPSPIYGPLPHQVQNVGTVVSKVTRTAFVCILFSNCNTVILAKGKGLEGPEGPEGLEGEETRGLWAEEGACRAEFTQGAEGARWEEFTPLECPAEFTQGAEGARVCRAEFTPGEEGVKVYRAEFTPGAEGAG